MIKENVLESANALMQSLSIFCNQLKNLNISSKDMDSVNPVKKGVVPPSGWLFLREFYEKLNFISDVSLSGLIKNNSEFFKDNYMSYKKKIYINPLYVCLFFEKGLYKHKELNNQYNRWKIASKEVRLYSERALKMIADEKLKKTSFVGILPF